MCKHSEFVVNKLFSKKLPPFQCQHLRLFKIHYGEEKTKMKLFLFGKVSCVIKWNLVSCMLFQRPAFKNKKPSLCLQLASTLYLLNSFRTWVRISNINLYVQPWSHLNLYTFDLCFLILPGSLKSGLPFFAVFVTGVPIFSLCQIHSCYLSCY